MITTGSCVCVCCITGLSPKLVVHEKEAFGV